MEEVEFREADNSQLAGNHRFWLAYIIQLIALSKYS